VLLNCGLTKSTKDEKSRLQVVFGGRLLDGAERLWLRFDNPKPLDFGCWIAGVSVNFFYLVGKAIEELVSSSWESLWAGVDFVWGIFIIVVIILTILFLKLTP
jgi:hypothetical protein